MMLSFVVFCVKCKEVICIVVKFGGFIFISNNCYIVFWVINNIFYDI